MEGGRRQTIDVNKTLPILIPVPDESPSLPINTDGEEFGKHHREFSAIKGLRKVEKAHVHSRPLTDVPGNELLGCKNCITTASVLAEGGLVQMWEAHFRQSSL